ncbi:MAG: hypothetical protein ACREMZ_15620 [Gemmatimonadales bacterium]
MNTHRWIVLGALVLAGSLASSPARAQVSAKAEEGIRAALPAESADRILATIAAARARELPAVALENRALELAAKGVKPSDIETEVNRHAQGLGQAKDALARGGRTRPTADETEAAANAMSKGVDGRAVSVLAQTAPSDRSVAVPIYVLSNLTQNGRGIQEALKQVQAALAAGVPDDQLGRRPDPRPAGRGLDKRPVTPPVSTPGAGRIPVPPARGQDLPEVPSSNPGLRP